MSRKARIWIGATLLAVILFNYLAIGVPLYKRIGYIDKKIRIFTRTSEDAYLADVLKKEAVSVDKKIVILNCAAVSAAIIVMSWLIFGLAIRREDRRKL